MTVAVIETAFFRLLVAAIGLAMLNHAGELTTGITAINLSSLTLRTDEKENAATRRTTKALPKRSFTLLMHNCLRVGWTAETEGGKI